MVGKNCELELQTEIALWRSKKRELNLIDKFSVRGELIEMHIEKGLTWSVEARFLPNCKDYTFTELDLKGYESPKFKLLFVALQTHIRSVEELLDKLYAFSCFLFHAKNDKRCWIIVDAQIMAVACKTAREATQEAAEAAAAFLVELMQPLPCFPRQSIITEEIRAPSFSVTEEAWNGVAQAAVNGGNVLQWCKVGVLETEMTFPSFEFEVALQDFLQGNDVISRIGLVNSRALKVSVCLEENPIRVVCSQEGVEPETYVGLSMLLAQLITNYIATAAERNEGEDGVKNVVEGLLQRVVGYLTFVPRVCEVCGSHRLFEDSSSRSFCTLCEARKEMCAWPIGLPLTQQRLSTFHVTDDENDDADDLFN